MMIYNLLVSGLVAQVVFDVRSAYSDTVQFSLSPDGNRMATLSERGALVVWDLTLRRKLASCLPEARSTLRYVSQTSYQGTRATGVCFGQGLESEIYLCNTESLQRWTWENNKLEVLFRFSKNTPPLDFPIASQLVCSRDGKFVCLMDVAGDIGIFNLSKIKESSLLPATGPAIVEGHRCAEFLPDSTGLLVTEGKSIHKILLASPSKRTDWFRAKGPIERLSLSASGRMLAVGIKGGRVGIVSMRTTETEAEWNGAPSGSCIGFSPNEEYIVDANDDGLTAIFSRKQKKEICSFQGPKVGMSGTGFLTNRTIFSVGEFAGYRLLTFQNGEIRPFQQR